MSSPVHVDRSNRRRRRVVGGVTLLLFAGLVGRLWHLQVVSSSDYDDLAAGNRTRLIQVEAPRGRILDAAGRPLADTRRSLVVVLDWEVLEDLSTARRRSVFEDLATELEHAGHGTTVDDLVEVYELSVGRSLRPTELLSDIDVALWVALEERALPGVGIEERSLRFYPHGLVAAHVLGHLGTVRNPADADALNLVAGPKRYVVGDVIGRAGIEQQYERDLRGVPEIRRVEIDAGNRVVRTVEVVQASRPGADVHLTIDLDLQLRAEQLVEQQLIEARQLDVATVDPDCVEGCEPRHASAGAFVALDPGTGRVVAMASYPSYDPSWFIGGLSQEQATTLFQDENQPLVNRAIAGQYPAGSAFKPVTAYAALTSGARAADEIWVDGGQHRLADCRDAGGGCVFRNAGGAVMGSVDLAAALARSSDTYFYSLAELFWNDRARFGDTPIQDAAGLFGLGRPTGIDLPNEQPGSIPTPARRTEAGGVWYTGDNVNLSIGQGEVLVTPLQLANLYASLFTGGHRHQPRLVSHVTDGETGQILTAYSPNRASTRSGASTLSPIALASIDAGLRGAVAWGTAARAFDGFPISDYPFAGKTGTAQVSGKADYSLFAGYGSSFDTPGFTSLAVAVILEEAGFGGVAAAPAARAFLDTALGLDSPALEPTNPQPMDESWLP